MVESGVPASRNILREHTPMKLGRCFMFKEGVPLWKKQRRRVDNLEGDSTGLLDDYVSFKVLHVTHISINNSPCTGRSELA